MKRANLYLSTLLLSVACACSEAPERLPSGRSRAVPGDGKDATPSERPGSGNGGGGKTGGGGTSPLPTDGLNSSELKLTLGKEVIHDALQYTYGTQGLSLTSSLQNPNIDVARSFVVKAGLNLSAEQKALATRFCKDMGLSTSDDSYSHPDTLQKELFVMWRSHFAGDVKSFLLDYLEKNKESLRCALMITLQSGAKKESTVLFLDAMPEKSELVSGSASLDKALQEGVLLAVKTAPKDLKNYSLEGIKDAAKIQLKTPALNKSDVKLETLAASKLETCYLTGSAAGSKPFNPKSQSGMSFKLNAPGEADVGDVKPSPVAGRDIKECAAAKVTKKDNTLDLKISCADYFAIKDKGLEAGCAFTLPITNKADAENSIALPVVMEKFVVKTHQVTDLYAAQIDSLIPISGINDIRDGRTDVTALPKHQKALLEDALDLWIALDEGSYRKYFYGYLKKYHSEACTADAKAPLNSDNMIWCNGGTLATSYAAKRFTDPGLILYRAMVTWHENMHSRGKNHDKDDKSYPPCTGAAASARIYVSAQNECLLGDVCKSFKPRIAGDYKFEMEYNFGSDERRKQGDCKKWADELGLVIN